jgi:predicted DsbA family dithiol-disulfide isomerase
MLLSYDASSTVATETDMTMSDTTVTIDIFSDIVCPWCVIGGVRLAKAMAQRPELTVVRNWHPFQLNPDQPAGIPWATYAEQRFGGAEKAKQLFAHVTNVAASEGITFDYDTVATAANTHDAHRLMLLASEYDLTWQMADALYNAYFSAGIDLNDRTAIGAIASTVGVPAERVSTLWAGDEYSDAVDESMETARRINVSGVPFFIFNQKFAVSGAQPTEIMLKALDAASGVITL